MYFLSFVMFLAIHMVYLRVANECSVSCWYWVLMYSVIP